MGLNETQTVTPRSAVVSDRVAALLAAEERSQAWLARKIDRGPMWLNNRLTGRTPWLVDDVEVVADALGVDVLDLVRADVDAVPAPRAADAGHAAVQVLVRVVFLLVVTAAAAVVAWHAPAGTPLAVLGAVAALYVLGRSVAAGGLR